MPGWAPDNDENDYDFLLYFTRNAPYIDSYKPLAEFRDRYTTGASEPVE